MTSPIQKSMLFVTAVSFAALAAVLYPFERPGKPRYSTFDDAAVSTTNEMTLYRYPDGSVDTKPPEYRVDGAFRHPLSPTNALGYEWYNEMFCQWTPAINSFKAAQGTLAYFYDHLTNNEDYMVELHYPNSNIVIIAPLVQDQAYTFCTDNGLKLGTVRINRATTNATFIAP